MIYFTSDLHLGHNKYFLYEPRGFTSIEEHDEQIIKNWNSIIKPEDDVYLLGDNMLMDNEHGMDCLGQLNGRIHIAYGNHDNAVRQELYHTLENVVEANCVIILKYRKKIFYLSHYPTLTSNTDDIKVINLCGHSHTKDRFADWDKGLIYHVELDAHDNKPVSIDEVLADIRSKITAVIPN